MCDSTSAWTASAAAPRSRATRGTWNSAAAGDTCGSRPDADVVTRSTGTGTPGFSARAAATKARILIFDEPTAALGVAQTEQVLNLVRRLADNGLAVILISHNMNDVMQVADNIAALYLGNMAAQVSKADVNAQQVVELITTGRSGDLGLQQAVTL